MDSYQCFCKQFGKLSCCYGATGCLFGQLVHTAFIPFGLLNLSELIIACSTLSHNTLSESSLVLTNVVLYTEFSQIRHRIGGVASWGRLLNERARPFPRFLFPETQNSASSCSPAVRQTCLVHNQRQLKPIQYRLMAIALLAKLRSLHTAAIQYP